MKRILHTTTMIWIQTRRELTYNIFIKRYILYIEIFDNLYEVYIVGVSTTTNNWYTVIFTTRNTHMSFNGTLWKMETILFAAPGN